MILLLAKVVMLSFSALNVWLMRLKPVSLMLFIFGFCYPSTTSGSSSSLPLGLLMLNWLLFSEPGVCTDVLPWLYYKS